MNFEWHLGSGNINDGNGCQVFHLKKRKSVSPTLVAGGIFISTSSPISDATAYVP